MQFVKFCDQVFAFHEEENATLARYMVANLHKVQCLSNRAVISCGETFTTKMIVLGSNGVPMMELRTTLDVRSLWNLTKLIKQYKDHYNGA